MPSPLELGVLPMRYEIAKNQLMFLHHIVVHLEEDDPVRKMWESMRTFTGEANWRSGVDTLLNKYKISLDDAFRHSKNKFKDLVKTAVDEEALNTLSCDCSEKKKTTNIKYTAIKHQEYLSMLYSTQKMQK